MANEFARAWSNLDPPGTRAAKEIDDAIRELREDVDQRMYQKIFTTQFPNTKDAADVVVKPEILGNAHKRILIHGTAFQAEESDVINYGDTGLDTYGPNEPHYAPLILPPSAVITRIIWLVTLTGTAHTFTMDLMSMLFDAALTLATLNTQSTSLISATPQTIDSGVLASPLTLDDSHFYLLKADSAGGVTALSSIHGVEILYDVADCRYTL